MSDVMGLLLGKFYKKEVDKHSPVVLTSVYTNFQLNILELTTLKKVQLTGPPETRFP